MATPIPPIGRFDAPERLRDLAPSLAAAAQRVYDEWLQVDGHDEELGSGGICQDVASAMVEALGRGGVDNALSVHSQVGENHVFVVAMLPDLGVYEIDIPPSVYEIGSGYVWTKRENVRFEADHVVIGRLGDPMTEDEFTERYAD